MRVLLLSAYDAQSHRRWREELVEALPAIDWRVLSLPPRHFSWRFRGNALAWHSHADLQCKPDAILATSMVDVATIKGLTPALAGVPVVLYFHENQFAFPVKGKSFTSLDVQLSSLYSALAADLLVFNSVWNRDSFLVGVEQLLASLPDTKPPGLVASLRDKASILAVPLRDNLFESGEDISLPSQAASGPLQIVWNHRWEYDKGPDRLLAFSKVLIATGKPFELHIVGQQFRQQPPEFDELRQLLQGAESATSGHFGFVPQASDYQALLRRADVVLSTALQDFQGLAVMEAVALGCRPLLPGRLAYPEFFPAEYLYEAFADDIQQEAAAAVHKLLETANTDSSSARLALRGLRWGSLAGEYDALLNSLSAKC